MHLSYIKCLVVAFAILLSARTASSADNPFIGNWALTVPGGYMGWLGIAETDGKLTGSILWRWGSVVPVDAVRLDGQRLILTRLHTTEQRDAGGQRTRTTITETVTATRDGDALKLSTVKTRPDGSQFEQADFTGKLLPPMPPAPELSRVKFDTIAQRK